MPKLSAFSADFLWGGGWGLFKVVLFLGIDFLSCVPHGSRVSDRQLLMNCLMEEGDCLFGI